MTVAICWFCSESGRVRLVDWWSPDGTPMCEDHAQSLFPEAFAEDVHPSKAYL